MRSIRKNQAISTPYWGRQLPNLLAMLDTAMRISWFSCKGRRQVTSTIVLATELVFMDDTQPTARFWSRK